jgi:hypothetical protein
LPGQKPLEVKDEDEEEDGAADGEDGSQDEAAEVEDEEQED